MNLQFMLGSCHVRSKIDLLEKVFKEAKDNRISTHHLPKNVICLQRWDDLDLQDHDDLVI